MKFAVIDLANAPGGAPLAGGLTVRPSRVRPSRVRPSGIRPIGALMIGAIVVASCGGSDSVSLPDGSTLDGSTFDTASAATVPALGQGDGLNSEGDAVCAALSVDVDLLVAAQSTERAGLREIERAPSDAGFLNVPQASGCLVGYAEPEQERRSAIVEAYTWPTSVIDATQFADVFADRQPDRFRDEPHDSPGDTTFLIVVDRDGEPQGLFGIVAEQGDRVVYVQSAGVGLDPAILEQAAAAVLAGL